MIETILQITGFITIWLLLSVLTMYLFRRYVLSDDRALDGEDIVAILMVMPLCLIMGIIEFFIDLIRSPFRKISKLEKQVKKLEKEMKKIKQCVKRDK